MKVEIREADYSDEQDAAHVVQLSDLYARDPMGQDKPLDEDVRESLIEGLRRMPTAFSLLAFADDEPVGLVNCIYSFSTFYACPLINIHDLMVKEEYRNRGIGEQLLEAVEHRAKEENCCKITLEVRQDNRAKSLYERFGFGEDETPMYFMTKKI